MPTPHTPTLSKAHRWNRITCDALHYSNAAPTIAARTLAMVHTAMYDAWTNFNDGGCEVSTTTGAKFKRPHAELISENREMAYSYAAYTVLTELFCARLRADKAGLFRDMMCACGYDPNDKSINVTSAVGLGNLSARLVLECYDGDRANFKGNLHPGGYSDWTEYAPVNPPLPQPQKVKDKWQPQNDANNLPQPFLTCHWGCVKPFALSWPGQFRPAAPAKAGSTDFKKQAEDVLNLSAKLTDEQKIYAEFWGGMHEARFEDAPKDGPTRKVSPPEQCCRMARYLSRERGYKNAFDIKLFFSLSNALHDAGIAAWDSKVVYDYVRPISAIQELYRGETVSAWGGICQGTQKIDGNAWVPYVSTPPFAEYVSGHSTFSAAAAEVLTSFSNGDNSYGESITIPKGSSGIEFNCTPATDVCLTWKTLHDAADEAGMSRRYGGIHFRDGDIAGRKLGVEVGCQVWNKVVKYFNGELG